MREVIVTKVKDPHENLCDSCAFHFPECEPDEGLLEYETVLDCDNITACDVYKHY